ncbi:MAG: hypothetical protein SF028_10965 [Candidatus Sumerlaeia bacterium]|nr:hypothetical protein [Candidatus Sumerlaeia bacterium]
MKEPISSEFLLSSTKQFSLGSLAEQFHLEQISTKTTPWIEQVREKSEVFKAVLNLGLTDSIHHAHLILGCGYALHGAVDCWRQWDEAASIVEADVLMTFAVAPDGESGIGCREKGVGFCLGVNLALRPASTLHWFVRRLLTLKKGVLSTRLNYDAPVAVIWFLCWLGAREQGDAIMEAHCAPHLLGTPYDNVRLAWDDDAKLAKAISQMLSYHVRNSSAFSMKANQFWGLESFFPFELIALICVRRRMGLTTPSVSHYLVDDNPLFVLPPTDYVPPSKVLKEHYVTVVFGKGFLDKACAEIESHPLTPWPTPKAPTGAEILKMVTAKRDEEELLDEVLSIPQLFHLDWKEVVEAGFDAITSALPDGLPFEWEELGGNRYKLGFDGRSELVEVRPTEGDEALWALDAVAAAEPLLKPGFEIFATRESMEDDGVTFLLMETKWWDTYRTKKGKHFAKTFAPLSELRKRSE